MRQLAKVSVLLVLILAIAGCTTFRLSGVQMVEDMPAMQPIGDFEITVKVNEFLGAPAGANFLNVTSTAMDDRIYDAVRREIQRSSGDAAINVTVEYKASFIDILLSGVTFNLWAPATAIVSGTVVSYN